MLKLREENTDCYRLFHGAVEGCPGLTVDRYGTVSQKTVGGSVLWMEAGGGGDFSSVWHLGFWQMLFDVSLSTAVTIP